MDKILLFHGQKFAISEFSRYIEYDFLKEDHKNNFHTKNQEDAQRRLEVKCQKPSKLSILVKKWPNFVNLRILIFILYDFLKKGSFHTKNYENLQRHLENIGQKHSKMAILAKKGQILTIFGHFGGQKIFRPKKFLVVI